MSWSVSYCDSGLAERVKFIEELGGTATVGKIGEVEVFYDAQPLLAASCELFGKNIILWEEDGGREPYMEMWDGELIPAGDGETVYTKLKMVIRE